MVIMSISNSGNKEQNNTNMLDIGFIYEALKGRPLNCPPVKTQNNSNNSSSSGGSPSLSTSPTGASNINTNDSYETENNLNKGVGDKGAYNDKRVLNINYDNYMFNSVLSGVAGVNISPNFRSNDSSSNCMPEHDKIHFNVSSPSDCRRPTNATGSNLLTCYCRSQSPSNGGTSVTSYNSNNSCSPLPLGASLNSASDGGLHNVSHKVSSLLPNVECRACFHNVCAPFSNSHACARQHDTLPPPTLPKDVVSTFFLFFNH